MGHERQKSLTERSLENIDNHTYFKISTALMPAMELK